MFTRHMVFQLESVEYSAEPSVVTMLLYLRYQTLLEMCYYQCDSNERRALKQYRTLRGLQKSPVTAPRLKKFEVTHGLSTYRNEKRSLIL